MEDKQTAFRIPMLLTEDRNLGITVLRIGHGMAHPNYRHVSISKPNYTLMIIVQGRGTIKTSSGSFHIKAGDVVLFWKGHAYEWWTDPTDLLQHYWINLSGEAVVDMFSCISTPTQCVQTRSITPQRERVLLGRLLELYQNHPPHYVWMSLAAFFEIWHSVVESVLDGRHIIHSPAHLAKMFIDNQYQTNISITDVAQYAGVTSHYLMTLFKKQYGITVCEYIIMCRMLLAKRLLQQGHCVGHVATAVGYKDTNYFSRLFRNRMGATPSQYRPRTRGTPPRHKPKSPDAR